MLNAGVFHEGHGLLGGTLPPRTEEIWGLKHSESHAGSRMEDINSLVFPSVPLYQKQCRHFTEEELLG